VGLPWFVGISAKPLHPLSEVLSPIFCPLCLFVDHIVQISDCYVNGATLFVAKCVFIA
jgi:hypothetical protein